MTIPRGLKLLVLAQPKKKIPAHSVTSENQAIKTSIVILGSPNDANGNLSTIAISRCKTAIEVYASNRDAKILCTGGTGEHFNQTERPHGHYTRNYLIQHGVAETNFLDIALSRFTIEDATLSKPILESNEVDSIILVTSDFHMERAGLIFQQAMPNIEISFAKAKTDINLVEFNRLVQHEKTATQRDLHNLKSQTTA